MGLTDDIATQLTLARKRSLALLEPLDDDALWRQHSPIMSPLVWDLAHIGNYEDLWLVRALGRPGVGVEHDDLYDAFRHPRRHRPALALLGPDAARTYLACVREQALDALINPRHTAMGVDGDDPLLAGGRVYGRVVQHAHQHDETMLATLQLMAAPGYRPRAPGPPRAAAPAGATPATASEVLVPGGPCVIGTDDDPWAYDNERPAHVVDVPAFFIDTTPVTNATYAAFVADSGYDDERWWTTAGWMWRHEASLTAPMTWRREGGGRAGGSGKGDTGAGGAGGRGWLRDRFGWIEPLADDEPVQHVCWYEADACARWLGRRLPTEAEWEKAASWDPAAGTKRRYPWGDADPSPTTANLGQRHMGPAAVGAYPAGTSAVGALGMVGDVWEWTASGFDPYPGTVAFPYREYSEVFYGGDYKVLRGGSWAADQTAVRNTFRNWDHPIRRQIFVGFRTARDAD